ncbi:MAG TPA: LptF/LptG family permease [Ohtaekwangia sp.]|nr:LptF/LptG family permease [Ohtaekwangia sp.]
MKKIDKLVIQAFISPLCFTFLVVVFILLNIQMMRNFGDLIGKGLDAGVILHLFFYFAVFTTPTALPLAILLSLLITFGNLGEHFELTAIKSTGISLTRVLRPLFITVCIITVMAFMINNYIVPRAALEAYSLLYDIKQKKPTLDLREGQFCNVINGISIKANKKYPDGVTFRDVVVYDHRKNVGNGEVIVADSGRLFTVMKDRFLKVELFHGYKYSTGDEAASDSRIKNVNTLSRSKFYKSLLVMDLSAFDLSRSDKNLFTGHRKMRTMAELDGDMDALKKQLKGHRQFQDDGKSNVIMQSQKNQIKSSDVGDENEIKEQANTEVREIRRELNAYQIQWHQIPASALACITMFLIGAPVGAIMKKGGFGIPFLLSVVFFIVYYVLTLQGENLAEQGILNSATGVWLANAVLFCFAIFFLYQARRDARLFDIDIDHLIFDKLRRWTILR